MREAGKCHDSRPHVERENMQIGSIEHIVNVTFSVLIQCMEEDWYKGQVLRRQEGEREN